MADNRSVGFLGGGQMASAIIKGLISAKQREPREIVVFDVNASQCEAAAAMGCGVAQSAVDLVKRCRVVLIAVKPDVVPKLLTELGSNVTASHLLISVAAGVTLAQIESKVAANVRVIRVMPNTPALVGQGATAIALGKSATKADEQIVLDIFGAVGTAYSVEEKMLDAVTGLSGSGPAYVFMFIEALADGGVRAGLPRPIALALAAQTVRGAASMVIETNVHPGELKDRVASPGGTTITGIHALERGGLRGVVMDAVLEAAKRATELGNPKL